MTPSCRLRILLVGETLVGKSCLFACVANEPFPEAYVRTFCVDFKVRTVQVDQEVVELQVWDSPGMFDYYTWKYSRHSHGVIVVYDVTDQSSLDKVPGWLRGLERHMREDVPLVICGNKSDIGSYPAGIMESITDPPRSSYLSLLPADLRNSLAPLFAEQRVSKDKVREVVDAFGLPHLETSAKLNVGVEELFVTITRTILERRKAPVTPPEPPRGTRRDRCSLS